ncbi:MAG: hypothetical protein IT518_06885 [Burkholderiales bacterium]|nr:hypothetical protein [Burkholderiales bacterium]
MTTNYPNTDPSDKSFVSVYGSAELSEAGIDHVWGCFLTLRHVITTTLRKMLSLTGFDPEIDFEEEGIASRVRWLTVLVCARYQDLEFDLGTEDPLDSWREIAVQCMRSEEWWRVVSALDCEAPGCANENGVANQMNANHTSLGWDGTNLFDVADYIRTCESYVDDFFRYCRRRR